ncbi:hypothetical protein NPIL_651021 [Nephila pilipes]|uniref:Uncharacterized protein n=1 Tax=Nephila pilipes TaxID=299642 RepID=A0A8X6NRB7_NEPPI|nr:hypothetical protein NPIL_651021 [Nephila pilipes]
MNSENFDIDLNEKTIFEVMKTVVTEKLAYGRDCKLRRNATGHGNSPALSMMYSVPSLNAARKFSIGTCQGETAMVYYMCMQLGEEAFRGQFETVYSR